MNENNGKFNWKKIFFVFEELGKVGEGEGFGDFNFNNLLKGFLKKKTDAEIEDSLIVGTEKTTPEISDISLKYPEPWLFGRLLLGSIILFYGFVAVYKQFEVANLIPAIILTGSFAVPISSLFFFFELNIRRNIPIWHVMRLVLMGGLLSIFITLLLSQNVSIFNGPTGAWFAALIEEPAKLITVVILVKNKKRYPYILNGLLFGASVGCGFASFESAGYALTYGMEDIDSLIGLIQLRGILSPFGHIAWTAIASASFWRVCKGEKIDFNLFFDKKFYIPFIMIIFMHSIWNSNSVIPFQGVYLILGITSWALILSIVNLGIKQISLEKGGKIMFKN